MGEEHKDAIGETARKERTKMTKSERVARFNERATLTKTETERSTYRFSSHTLRNESTKQVDDVARSLVRGSRERLAPRC